RLRFSGPKTSIICSPMTSLKTSIKTITYLSDIGCLEIQGASLYLIWLSVYLNNVERDFSQETLYKKYKIQLSVAKDTISLAKNTTQHKC
ncbi:hypothetical protein, partial [Escherichia coli]|uniref:hypothetical protein n=1 Tax=Escherichia coli TaxID=562 RepID=UPI003B519BCD